MLFELLNERLSLIRLSVQNNRLDSETLWRNASSSAFEA